MSRVVPLLAAAMLLATAVAADAQMTSPPTQIPNGLSGPGGTETFTNAPQMQSYPAAAGTVVTPRRSHAPSPAPRHLHRAK